MMTAKFKTRTPKNAAQDRRASELKVYLSKSSNNLNDLLDPEDQAKTQLRTMDGRKAVNHYPKSKTRQAQMRE